MLALCVKNERFRKGIAMERQELLFVQDERVKSVFYRVYGWMSLALIITGTVAYSCATSLYAMRILFNTPYLFVSLVFAGFVIASFFSYRLPRLSYTTALITFMAYALLSGVTLSAVAFLYEPVSIMSTLLITAGMFGITALYGYSTDADLSSIGSALYMALAGIILSFLVNSLWLHSSGFNFMISCMGVLVFSALTAYDTYKIKQYALNIVHNEEYAKVALRGAFELYLDFVNLFLYLLRIAGKRKR